MVTTHPSTEEAYTELVLANPDRQLELYDGEVWERPGMSWGHGEVVMRLSQQLLLQLDLRQFKVRMNEGRVRRAPGTIFIPDLIVVPASYGDEFANQPDKLAIITAPAPLVVEVWSRSTGHYDVDIKLRVYQQRGDREIWCIHPYDKTLTSWVRQPDGTYEQTVHQDGVIRPVALPGVEIDIVALFES